MISITTKSPYAVLALAELGRSGGTDPAATPLGIGLSSYVERSGGEPGALYEFAGVEACPDGTVVADGIEAEKLRIVDFQNPGGLNRVGTSYFQASPDMVPAPAAAEVRQRPRGNASAQPAR